MAPPPEALRDGAVRLVEDEKSVDAAAEDWEDHQEGWTKEDEAEAEAARERQAELEEYMAEEAEIEAEEREEAMEAAREELEEAAEGDGEEPPAPDADNARPKNTGGSGGLAKAAKSYGPLGIKGEGPSWGEKRIRDVGRNISNFFTTTLPNIGLGILKYLQDSAAKMSFSWLPGSKSKEIDKTPALESHLDKPEGGKKKE